MSETFLPILIISILILLNGIFVAAEFSIVSAPRTRMAQLADEGNEAAQITLKTQIEPVLQNRYIATAQIGITIVSLGLGMYGEHVIAEWVLHFLERFWEITTATESLIHTVATVASVGLLTYLHVVLGEMIPKTLALQAPETTVLGLARPMSILERLFMPFVVVLNATGNFIVRGLGIHAPKEGERLFTPEELEFIVEESSEGGMLDPGEQLFIENIFDLEERTVEQVMTPRTQIIGIPIHATPADILQRICETRRTRYPIYEGNFDQIIGVLHIKDLARHLSRSNQGELNLKQLARPVMFVPASIHLAQVLTRFRQDNAQFAVAIDEYGGTAGIISLEDLVEEVVGEIQDEFDKEIAPIEEVSARVLRVRGDVILDELNQLYDLKLDSEDAYTIGGFVMALLGRIPLPKDQVMHEGVKFEVENVERLAVQSILIHLPDEPDQAEVHLPTEPTT
ncbi:MAG: HlyC/CorC family transporter [Anaerolineales bacterium]|nr:HlyC/CorC family transporter [Anaerolineales bacterium]